MHSRHSAQLIFPLFYWTKQSIKYRTFSSTKVSRPVNRNSIQQTCNIRMSFLHVSVMSPYGALISKQKASNNHIAGGIILKSCTFWDVTPCSLLKAKLHFGGTCRLHLQGWRVNQTRNLNEAGNKQSFAWRFGIKHRLQFVQNPWGTTDALKERLLCKSRAIAQAVSRRHPTSVVRLRS
jgi:hypothetical protein